MKKLNVLIIGSGGREHSLSWKINQSPRLNKLFVAPGNAGTEEIAENVPIKADDLKRLAQFAVNNSIDLSIVGPDDALAAGIVDVFMQKGLRILGPNKKATKIEASKQYSKSLMAKANIPTANFRIYKEYKTAKHSLEKATFPLVIKASGLALGKGVFVCKDLKNANQALKEIMLDKKFGQAGNTVVIEEYLGGPEVSIHAFCDGKTAVLFPSSQDHKPVFDGDKGPNTGGMGTIAPVPWFSNGLLLQAKEDIVIPILNGLENDSRKFIGILYPGLKITNKELKVLEFNARFGDPECQSYMRLLETDLINIVEACVEGKLTSLDIKWSNKFAANIVLASEGYPGEYKKGLPISGVAEAEQLKDIVVFHAGTKLNNGQLETNGGRVLNVCATGKTLEEALNKAYGAIKKIYFEGMQYRKDIGLNSLKK